MRADFTEGYGEIAGVLLRVARYALERFGVGDVLFGVYHLAQHHADTDAVDRVDGTPVKDRALVEYLLYCCDLATMAYCPTKEAMCDAADIKVLLLLLLLLFLLLLRCCGCALHCALSLSLFLIITLVTNIHTTTLLQTKQKPEDVLIFRPDADTNRPAYAVVLDHSKKKVVWGFRGTTNLEVSRVLVVVRVCACVAVGGGWGTITHKQPKTKHKNKRNTTTTTKKPKKRTC